MMAATELTSKKSVESERRRRRAVVGMTRRHPVSTAVLMALSIVAMVVPRTAAFSPHKSSRRNHPTTPFQQHHHIRFPVWGLHQSSASSEETLLTESSVATQPPQQQQQPQQDSSTPKETTSSETNDHHPETPITSIDVAKTELLDLLPRMKGQAHEFRRVETLVNALEDLYPPIETLEFFNLLQQGEWQLLFSTNLAANRHAPSPQIFRMREILQSVNVTTNNIQKAHQSTTVTWDLAQEMPGQFDVTGTFTVQCDTQFLSPPAKFQLNLTNVILQPKGKTLPKDVQALVGLLHRAMPLELFDPKDHAYDTTFLDHDIKIIRYTAGTGTAGTANYEGVRDIWIRKGASLWTATKNDDTTATTEARKEEKEEEYDPMMMMMEEEEANDFLEE